MSSFVESKIKGKKVVIFSMKTCPACVVAKTVFRSYLSRGELSQADYEVVEIDNLTLRDEVMDYLLRKTGARTVPRVFINGQSVGGGDDVARLDKNGQLKQLLGGQKTTVSSRDSCATSGRSSTFSTSKSGGSCGSYGGCAPQSYGKSSACNSYSGCPPRSTRTSSSACNSYSGCAPRRTGTGTSSSACSSYSGCPPRTSGSSSACSTYGGCAPKSSQGSSSYGGCYSARYGGGCYTSSSGYSSGCGGGGCSSGYCGDSCRSSGGYAAGYSVGSCSRYGGCPSQYGCEYGGSCSGYGC